VTENNKIQQSHLEEELMKLTCEMELYAEYMVLTSHKEESDYFKGFDKGKAIAYFMIDEAIEDILAGKSSVSIHNYLKNAYNKFHKILNSKKNHIP